MPPVGLAVPTPLGAIADKRMSVCFVISVSFVCDDFLSGWWEAHLFCKCISL